jgi:hypothetical protein
MQILSGACNYFSAQASHLHGRAQLENNKYTKNYNVSAMYGHRSHGGGCCCFGGCGRFAGRSGGVSGGPGVGGNNRSNFINGIDVLDPTQNFTGEEWRKLVYNGGWLYVAQARE